MVMVLCISLPFQAIQLSKASLSPRRNSLITDDWIMKKVAMAAVSSIEVHSLSSKQPYHYLGYRHTVRNE